jgi:hypothetical protein
VAGLSVMMLNYPSTHNNNNKEVHKMTATETNEQRKAREKRKREADRDADMIAAYMAGNVGSVYMMEAAAQASSE